MTTEELATERNEVREILEGFSEELSQSNLNELSRVFCLINGDEKRIAELEQELVEYKEVFGSCETCKRTCDIGNCCDPRTKNGYLLDKVKVLTERQKILKENAELKRDRDLAVRYFHEQTFDLEVTKDNLIKAKDHIKRLLGCLQQDTNDSQTNYYVVQYMTEAEQFLKENT